MFSYSLTRSDGSAWDMLFHLNVVFVHDLILQLARRRSKVKPQSPFDATSDLFDSLVFVPGCAIWLHNEHQLGGLDNGLKAVARFGPE